jgi:hypothetical protein
MAEDAKRIPEFRAYMVLGNGEKRFWRELGAAFSHRDGLGMTLKLDAMPLGKTDIVLRSTSQEATGDEPELAGTPETASRRKPPAPTHG